MAFSVLKRAFINKRNSLKKLTIYLKTFDKIQITNVNPIITNIFSTDRFYE